MSIKVNKLLDKKVGNAINEYNRVNRILYPNVETVWLTEEQSNALALDTIDSLIGALAAERDRILLEQSKRELAGYNDYHQAMPSTYDDTKTKTKKL
jgi:hypothetical protein